LRRPTIHIAQGIPAWCLLDFIHTLFFLLPQRHLGVTDPWEYGFSRAFINSMGAAKAALPEMIFLHKKREPRKAPFSQSSIKGCKD
ncbi:MAG: hypothetical protein Q9M18_05930, partial [Mariprofundaceae bacterium]|nr:hypothetical protein [Mariprofundaceae bacterium]